MSSSQRSFTRLLYTTLCLRFPNAHGALFVMENQKRTNVQLTAQMAASRSEERGASERRVRGENEERKREGASDEEGKTRMRNESDVRRIPVRQQAGIRRRDSGVHQKHSNSTKFCAIEMILMKHCSQSLAPLSVGASLWPVRYVTNTLICTVKKGGKKQKPHLRVASYESAGSLLDWHSKKLHSKNDFIVRSSSLVRLLSSNCIERVRWTLLS